MKDLFEKLTDEQVRTAVHEIIFDDEVNNGIITSKYVRDFAQIASTKNNCDTSHNIFLVTVSFLKEGCKRFIK